MCVFEHEKQNASRGKSKQKMRSERLSETISSICPSTAKNYGDFSWFTLFFFLGVIEQRRSIWGLQIKTIVFNVNLQRQHDLLTGQHCSHQAAAGLMSHCCVSLMSSQLVENRLWALVGFTVCLHFITQKKKTWLTMFCSFLLILAGWWRPPARLRSATVPAQTS